MPMPCVRPSLFRAQRSLHTCWPDRSLSPPRLQDKRLSIQKRATLRPLMASWMGRASVSLDSGESGALPPPWSATASFLSVGTRWALFRWSEVCFGYKPHEELLLYITEGCLSPSRICVWFYNPGIFCL